MIITDDIQITLHLTLRRLIEEKSKRDNVKFTGCQLAHALGMPRSMITKLTHPDKNKRVTNPRIDTLIKIIEFFKADGFNITLEDLLGLKTKTINVKNQLFFCFGKFARTKVSQLHLTISLNLLTFY